MPILSIVCPAYEEEEVLPLFHRQLCAVLEPLQARYQVEIIYVDDGSRDRTLALLREWSARDARVRYISLSRNFGHQAALTAGMEHAAGNVVITLDSDLQHPPALIPQLLASWEEGYEVVLTIRADDPRAGWFKRLTSKAFYRLINWLSDTEIRFAAADFRLLSRRAVDSLLELRERHRFLRGMVQWLGFPTTEVPYQPAMRGAGVSKYTVRRMLNFATDALLSFSRLPLRLGLGLGLLTVGLSLLYLGAATVRAIFRGTHGFGAVAVLASFYLLGGAILCVLGIIGEYVGRIYEQVKGRPLYIIKEQSADTAIVPTRTGLPESGWPQATPGHDDRTSAA
ncbi:MAG TPA: glycosyltransferase family 2 protein [Gemmataceae bacterium]|nr:glycosyltransferase family 2 protein [Gemmataceae bacterium]